LLGLGETPQQRIEALDLLALLHRQWGHIQEVILQPWQPEADAARPLPIDELLETIAAAREILPPAVHLQLPPNLWPRDHLPAALEAGIDDLGGIDCTDVINPSWPQPSLVELRAELAAAGWFLQPRACVHETWIPLLPKGLQGPVRRVQRQLLTAG
jgi:FO synthase subunit 1